MLQGYHRDIIQTVGNSTEKKLTYKLQGRRWEGTCVHRGTFKLKDTFETYQPNATYGLYQDLIQTMNCKNLL